MSARSSKWTSSQRSPTPPPPRSEGMMEKALICSAKFSEVLQVSLASFQHGPIFYFDFCQLDRVFELSGGPITFICTSLCQKDTYSAGYH